MRNQVNLIPCGQITHLDPSRAELPIWLVVTAVGVARSSISSPVESDRQTQQQHNRKQGGTAFSARTRRSGSVSRMRLSIWLRRTRFSSSRYSIWRNSSSLTLPLTLANTRFQGTGDFLRVSEGVEDQRNRSSRRADSAGRVF